MLRIAYKNEVVFCNSFLCDREGCNNYQICNIDRSDDKQKYEELYLDAE